MPRERPSLFTMPIYDFFFQMGQGVHTAQDKLIKRANTTHENSGPTDKDNQLVQMAFKDFTVLNSIINLSLINCEHGITSTETKNKLKNNLHSDNT